MPQLQNCRSRNCESFDENVSKTDRPTTSHRRGCLPERELPKDGLSSIQLVRNGLSCRSVARMSREELRMGNNYARSGRSRGAGNLFSRCGHPAVAIQSKNQPGLNRAVTWLRSSERRVGGRAMSKQAAEHHHKAAEHHEHAARHHKEAAKHHEAGRHETAAHHAHLAHGHHEHATHHASEAAKAHVEHHGKAQTAHA
jgi:hypothetical protein